MGRNRFGEDTYADDQQQVDDLNASVNNSPDTSSPNYGDVWNATSNRDVTSGGDVQSNPTTTPWRPSDLPTWNPDLGDYEAPRSSSPSSDSRQPSGGPSSDNSGGSSGSRADKPYGNPYGEPGAPGPQPGTPRQAPSRPGTPGLLNPGAFGSHGPASTRPLISDNSGYGDTRPRIPAPYGAFTIDTPNGAKTPAQMAQELYDAGWGYGPGEDVTSLNAVVAAYNRTAGGGKVSPGPAAPGRPLAPGPSTYIYNYGNPYGGSPWMPATRQQPSGSGEYEHMAAASPDVWWATEGPDWGHYPTGTTQVTEANRPWHPYSQLDAAQAAAAGGV